jgi:hypothetical protein
MLDCQIRYMKNIWYVLWVKMNSIYVREIAKQFFSTFDDKKCEIQGKTNNEVVVKGVVVGISWMPSLSSKRP